MKPKQLNIRYKIAISFATIVILFSIFSIGLNYNRTYNQGKLDNENMGWSIAVNITPHLAHHLYIDDIIGTQRTLKLTVDNNSDIEYIFLLNKEGNLVAHTFGEEFPVDLLNINTEGKQQLEIVDVGHYRIFDFAYPIENGLLGTLRIGISDQRLKDQLIHNIKISLFFLIIAISLAVISAILLSRIITKTYSFCSKSCQREF